MTEMAKSLGVPRKRFAYWMRRRQLPLIWARQLNLTDRRLEGWRLRNANDIQNVVPECIRLDYRLGRIIGLYAAEGSREKNTVKFHINNGAVPTIGFISRYFRQFGISPKYSDSPGCVTVHINSSWAYQLITHFLKGNVAREKNLRIEGAPQEFKIGIFDGLLEGDGHWMKKDNRECFVSTSHDLAYFVHRHVQQVEGIRSYARWNENTRSYKVVFDPKRKFDGVVVRSIERSCPRPMVDIAVDSDDHTFLLADGIVTHNCSIGMGYNYRSQHEHILFCKKGKRPMNNKGWGDILKHKRIRSKNAYPTQKPVGLFEQMVLQSSDEGGLVLDPFMGSGSSGVAALSTGRRFVGCDIALGAVELSRGRLSMIC